MYFLHGACSAHGARCMRGARAAHAQCMQMRALAFSTVQPFPKTALPLFGAAMPLFVAALAL